MIKGVNFRKLCGEREESHHEDEKENIHVEKTTSKHFHLLLVVSITPFLSLTSDSLRFNYLKKKGCNYLA